MNVNMFITVSKSKINPLLPLPIFLLLFFTFLEFSQYIYIFFSWEEEIQNHGLEPATFEQNYMHLQIIQSLLLLITINFNIVPLIALVFSTDKNLIYHISLIELLLRLNELIWVKYLW